MVTVHAMEDMDVNVEDTPEQNANKKRKLENGAGSCSSDKEDSDLQVVDDDIDVSGEPTFIEEVMDEGGGEDVQGGMVHVTETVQPSTTAVSVINQPSSQEPSVVTAASTAASVVVSSAAAVVSSGSLARPMGPPPSLIPAMNIRTLPNMIPSPAHSVAALAHSMASSAHSMTAPINNMTASAHSITALANSMTAPVNSMTAPAYNMTSNSQNNSATTSSPTNMMPSITLASQSMMPNLAQPQPAMPSLAPVGSNNLSAANTPPSVTPQHHSAQNHIQVLENNTPSAPTSIPNLPIPSTLASPVSNSVGMTAHALLETLFAQVIAHSMNGTSGGQHPPPPAAASPNVAFNPAEPSCPKVEAPAAGSPAAPEVKEVPLKEALDKINMLEQNTASLDKQSAGLHRIVTEVVKKQEENTSASGILCPRCKHYVVAGEEFISHLIVKHNFIEQKGPPQKADFGSQAGLGTCRGWRYIRTKNSGTQSTLSMVGKKEQVIDLTNSNDTTPPPDPVQPKVIPAVVQSPQTSTQSEQMQRPSPRTHPISPRAIQAQGGSGYDSARATAAGLLSFVFGNPDINKQFTDFAELPKEAAVRSPKKPFPPYGHLPFLQTINKQLQAHNGLAVFDRMKEVKPMSPSITTAQQMQKELMAQALKQQQLHHQQQQQQMQQQQLQHAQQAAQQRAMHAQQSSILHPSPIIHSQMQPMQQPIQPTPIQASSLQQIRPHGSNFPGQSPMISVGELKEYQHMFTGGQKMNAFDESNDSPLKECYPKVRASLVNGDIQLMWNIIGDERKCTGYRLFAYMGATAPPISSTWTEVGTVKALPMPMAVTLSQFSKGCSYHFTVRAIDSAGNLGPFSEPCSIKLSL